jgi:hypothetical protein
MTLLRERNGLMTKSLVALFGAHIASGCWLDLLRPANPLLIQAKLTARLAAHRRRSGRTVVGPLSRRRSGP